MKALNLRYLISAVVLAVSLYFFYLKYVPLVAPFQWIFFPILILLFVLTCFRLRWGILLFVFLFPLINNLPYFFGIYQNIPHAPTALTLFLFFFLGWLFHRSFSLSDSAARTTLFKPLGFFTLLILVSGVITLFRYANFYPFLTSRVYELVTNVDGVSSGGAMMSTLFFTLNYLTGFALFMLLVRTVKSQKVLQEVLLVLGISTLLALGFGLFQHLFAHSLGNTLRGISEGLINGTFKDVLSFGVYIGMIVPLFFGLFLSLKGAVRLLPLLLSLVGMYMIFVIGSRSGLLCVWVSVLVFAVLFLGRISVRKSWNKRSSIFILGGASLVLLGFLAVTALFFLSDGKILKSKTLERWSPILQQRARGSATSPRFHLWKNAALMMKDYPLSGTGIGSYIIEVPNYAQIHHVPIIAPQSAENYLLQVGSELGAAGLIFVLWIFWEIIRQMKRRYAASLVNDKSGFILIGAMAGIASYFVNIQFHTYIGSYEIKYMFWLLVAVLFCCRPNDESRERKSFFASKINLLSILLIVVFAGVHLWNSTHSLSLKRRTEMFDLTQYFGLSKKEVTAAGEEFQWTGSYGGKTIRITGSVMILPLLASHPDIGDNPVTVRISTTTDFFREKTVLKEVVMDTGGWREYELDVASKVGLKVILLVEVNRTWNPQKVMGTSDPRNLGVAIGTIRFKGKPVS